MALMEQGILVLPLRRVLVNYAIGIANNGERLRFERWLYEAWLHGNVGDEFLLRSLRRCVSFTILW
jgi:hypothetical protein